MVYLCCWCMSSGVARAFPGGRPAHPEGQNEEKISKVWGRKKLSKFEEKMRKVELLPTQNFEAGYGPVHELSWNRSQILTSRISVTGGVCVKPLLSESLSVGTSIKILRAWWGQEGLGESENKNAREARKNLLFVTGMCGHIDPHFQTACHWMTPFLFFTFCSKIESLTKWPPLFLQTEVFTKRPLLFFIVLTKWPPIFLLVPQCRFYLSHLCSIVVFLYQNLQRKASTLWNWVCC